MRIWQTLLILALGTFSGAVTLFHSTVYWVNHAQVLKDCKTFLTWNPNKYWTYHATIFGNMYMVRVALSVLTVQFFTTGLLMIGWLLVNASEKVLHKYGDKI